MHKELFLMQDKEYKVFTQRLIPNIKPDLIIGIRTPVLRRFAASFSKSEALEFMQNLPHRYYEENNLHAFLIERIGDYDETVAELERFLPFVDNWATCDTMRPKVLVKHKTELLIKIDRWLSSTHVYAVRYAIELLMCYYLNGDFKAEYADRVAAVESEEYYINMMIAWYFATALAKQYDSVLPYIKERKLSKWSHNKAIQKAIESHRISVCQKNYLRTLKY